MPSPSSSPQREGSPARQRSRDRQQEEDNNTCLYIGNIDKRVDDEQLKDTFRKFGELEYCYLVYEPSSAERSSKEVRISRGYGFAKFVKMDDLVKAKNELDGFAINGRNIKVEFSKRSKPREATPGRYLGKKKQSPVRERDGRRHRDRSYSRSSSDSYRRRRSEKKQKHRKRRDRSRDSRSRSRDRGDDYRRRKSSYSEERDRRRKQ